MADRITDQYLEMYAQTGFDRAGLFKLISETINPKTVVYPGCSIHITPSLFFRHVVYIDKADHAHQFFSDKAAVDKLISASKNYRAPAYWKFYHLDFLAPLPLLENSYDLLISLFSGNQLDATARYVRKGGWILSASLYSGHDFFKTSKQFRLVHTIRSQSGHYKPITGKTSAKHRDSRLLKSGKFIDNEIYYLYQRTL